MSIDSIPPSGTPEPGARRSDPASPGQASQPARHRPGASADNDATTDRVEVSEAALRLASGADIPSGTLSPDRLAELTRRLADGSVDSSAARDAVAHALRGELGN